MTAEVLNTILTHTKSNTKECDKSCYDFKVMRSPYLGSNYFVRYTKIDASDPDFINTAYEWLCFDLKGSIMDCTPIFNDSETEYEFKQSMIIIHETKKIES